MILLYNTNDTRNPNAYLGLAVEDALRALVGAEGVMRVDTRMLAPAAATAEHDLLICIDGQRLDAGLIARVRPAFRRIVLWAFEDPFMLDYNLAHMDLFDLIFTNDPSCVPAYRGRGHFLPLAASRMLQYRDVLPDHQLRYDIFFAGTMWPNRVSVLRRVIAAFPDASMKLVCPTNEYLPPLPPQIAERAITRPVSHEAFIDFANASRVTLTLFRDYASHGASGLATAPGPRLFELGLAGTAQVVERHDRMSAEHFADLDGIVLARDDTLIARIAGILADPGQRASLALRAQNSVAAAHGYEHRLRRLLELSMDEMPGRQATARPRKLRVLMCTHSTIHNHVWGGVEVYQQMLCSMLDREIDALYWVRRGGSCQLLDAQGKILERYDGEDIGWLDVLCDDFEERHFSAVLAAYDIDIVHFQHLGHHAASLPLIAKASGVGTLLSVHDFFLVCSRYNLLDHEQKFCDIGNRSITACTICLGAAEGLPAGAQQQRRGFMEQMLHSVDLLLFGSRQSEELVLRIYPQIRARARLVMGIPAPRSPLPPPPLPPPLPGPRVAPHPADGDAHRLDVMVVGNFLRGKGADAVLKVIETADPKLFGFHIMGRVEPDYLAALERLGAGRQVTCHGSYAPGELPLPRRHVADGEAAGGDATGGDSARGAVALHLSIWPETWCISLSEVWQAGLIPIVTDIGALGERVSHGVNGFKVGVGDAAAVLDLLEVLRANPGLRDRLRANIGPHLWVDADAYVRKILASYRALAPKARLGTSAGGFPLALDVARLHLLPQSHWKTRATSRHILDTPAGRPLKLDLPAAILDWSSIQQCAFHVDEICGQEVFSKEPEAALGPKPASGFKPADGFSIKGWVFQAGTREAGQVFVCLIHRSGRHVVFLEAERLARVDVQATLPEAPLYSGYTAKVSLPGKWADGEHGIGVIVVINGQAAFQLSAYRVSFLDGRAIGWAVTSVDQAAVLRGFAGVFAASPQADGFAPAPAAPPPDPVMIPPPLDTRSARTRASLRTSAGGT